MMSEKEYRVENENRSCSSVLEAFEKSCGRKWISEQKKGGSGIVIEVDG